MINVRKTGSETEGATRIYRPSPWPCTVAHRISPTAPSSSRVHRKRLAGVNKSVPIVFNHVHLVMVPNEEDGLRTVLGETHRRYTRYVNFREGWRGHLWQERFHSFVMDEAYLMATVRYVERNPVSAGLCRTAQEWPWSSAVTDISGNDDKLVSVKPMLDRVTDWAAYLADNHAPGDNHELIQQHTRTGRPLGSGRFVGMVELLTGKALMPRPAGRRPVRDAK